MKVCQVFEDSGNCLDAPEVKEGEPHDTSSDVWQLGQLAYQLLSRPVSDGQAPRALKYEDAEQEPDWLPWVSDAVKFIINSMVRHNPTERPTVTQVLGHPWFDSCFK